MMFLATFIATQSKIDITDTQLVGRISSASIYANSMSILRRTYEERKNERSFPKTEPPPIFDWHEFGIIMFMAKNKPAGNGTTMTTMTTMIANEINDSTIVNTITGNLSTTTSIIETKDKATNQSKIDNNNKPKPINTIHKQNQIPTKNPSTGYRDIFIIASIIVTVAAIAACVQVGYDDNGW